MTPIIPTQIFTSSSLLLFSLRMSSLHSNAIHSDTIAKKGYKTKISHWNFVQVILREKLSRPFKNTSTLELAFSARCQCKTAFSEALLQSRHTALDSAQGFFKFLKNEKPLQSGLAFTVQHTRSMSKQIFWHTKQTWTTIAQGYIIQKPHSNARNISFFFCINSRRFSEKHADRGHSASSFCYVPTRQISLENGGEVRCHFTPSRVSLALFRAEGQNVTGVEGILSAAARKDLQNIRHHAFYKLPFSVPHTEKCAKSTRAGCLCSNFAVSHFLFKQHKTVSCGMLTGKHRK